MGLSRQTRPGAPVTEQLEDKAVSCASVKSASTFGGRDSALFIAHVRSDLLSNGNIADFARSMRDFSDLDGSLSGNQGPAT